MEAKRIGGYELRDVLGEGGMGVVYRGHDSTLDRPAAIKVIRPKTLSDDGKQRFLREARACSKINHPNIITVYAAGEEHGTPYMAMELIDGRTLKDLIGEGAIPWREATRWIVQLLDALQRLHAEGIVHRDLKPENIMVTREGVIKLMDFGLAHLATSSLTQDGTTLGTAPYMSPEQVTGQKVSARSDLFSLATIYQEMLTGAHPFRGDHPMAVMYSIRSEAPIPLQVAAGDFPPGLSGVLSRAFEKNPENRIPDAAAFRDAILAEVPDLASTVVITSSKRTAVMVALIAVAVFGAGLAGWNVYQDRRVAADRTAARNLNEMGSAKESAGDVAGAEADYRSAVDKDRHYAVPYNNLGMLALRAGSRAEADSMFRLAVARDPKYSAALCNLGNLFFDTNLDSAEACYRRALDGDDPALAGNQLGGLLLARGLFKDARAVLEAALATNPTNPDVRSALVRNLGKVAAAMGDSTASTP